MVGAAHVVVAELSSVIEDEVVGNVFDGSLRESGLIHHRGVLYVLAPTLCCKRGEGSFFAAPLAVGGDEVEGFVLKRFGQTDHARSELLAAHSSAPDDEEGDFAFEVGGGFEFRAGPVLAPCDLFGHASNLGVVLVPTEGGEREAGDGEEEFNHVVEGRSGFG